jgi:hypothetical protein
MTSAEPSVLFDAQAGVGGFDSPRSGARTPLELKNDHSIAIFDYSINEKMSNWLVLLFR